MKTAAATNEPSGRRILICDAERHIARMIQVNLERQGYFVTCVHSAPEAIDLLEMLELLEGPGFDMAIVDLMMHGMEGLKVLKCIRENDTTKEMEVVLMIPHGLDREVLNQSPYRADRYIEKPLQPTDPPRWF